MRHFFCFALVFSVLAPAIILPNPAQAQKIPPELVEKAASEDIVRVIVRLVAPYDIKSALDAKAAIAQEAAIASVQATFSASLGELDYFEAIPGLPLSVIEVSSDQLADLRENGLVQSVIEDTLSEPYLDDSIPIIEADAAWSAGNSGAGQTVAVLDTGVDAGHSMLSGKVVSQACYSTTSSANGGSQSLCPNGQASMTGGNAGRDCPLSITGCGHGTHVAGIVAGKGGSFQGVAKDADIIAVQVFSRFNSQTTCGSNPAPCALSYTSDQIKGLTQVKALADSFTIASINMSLGGGKNTSPCDADSRKAIIDQLRALKIATVIASGNSGFSDGVGAPGCISSAITVGSTTKSDNLSSFSNSHAMVDLLAPGSSITSSLSGGGTGPKSGTSMATPHVAGAFAVHKSMNPGDSISVIEAKLESEGKPVTGKGITKPRIDLGYLGVVPILPPPVGKSPLVFGTVWANGIRNVGFGDWISNYNATYQRYEITISGHSYYYLNYATIVTPAGDTRFCRSSSVSGKLLVYCYDKNGRPATSRFGFLTYQ